MIRWPTVLAWTISPLLWLLLLVVYLLHRKG